MGDQHEALQRVKRMRSFSECAVSAAIMRDGLHGYDASATDNPSKKHPLYAERRLVDAAAEFLGAARDMVWATDAVTADVREQIEEACQVLFRMHAKLEVETARLRCVKKEV